MKKILMAKPQIGWQERRQVNRVLKSLKLAQGPEVKAFEDEFSKFVDGRDCVAVNSGTSALHLALLSLGIKEGDEVIVPSFTFAATANVVILSGAKPVFVDIDLDTYCIDPKAIQAAITPKTKAIIVVHLFGLPANMQEIKALSKQYSIYIVEDCAQSHLAKINEQFVGTFGDAAAFSFYPTKNMTSGEGGMIVLNNSQQTRTCRLLRNQGMERKYQNEIAGYNLRMTDIHAAIGRSQLRKLSRATEKRIRNAKYLTERLEIDTTPIIPQGFTHVFNQYTLRIINNRDNLSKNLSNYGIGNEVYYPKPVHKLPSFNSPSDLPNTERATKEVLSIPVHPSLSRIQLDRIVRVFNRNFIKDSSN
jgi:dTDP-4-amino-4,6-dideoxygalactose transaminase